jgi:uncharacterized protein (TIGR02217 family)
MTNLVFPRLRGVEWGTRFIPTWKTDLQEARSGRDTTARRWLNPRYRVELTYEFFGEQQPAAADDGSAVFSDLDTIMGFFNLMAGQADTFLYQGVNDIDAARFVVQGQPIATGNGVTTDFQLVRSVGPATEWVQNPMAPPTFYSGGAEIDPSAITDLGKGKYRLAPAPANGAPVMADFTWAFRCRFNADEVEFENFMSYFWSCGSVPLITIKQ